MKANKWIVAMTAGVMAIGILSGCGNSDTPSGQNREPQSAAAVQEEKRTKASETGGNGGETEGALEKTGTSIAIESESAKKDAPQGGKTLVVYYSASGHTEDVANVIADEMGADLFELEPVNPYTSDDLNYTNADSRVSREHGMRSSGMWNWYLWKWRTGMYMKPCLSDIPYGGESPHGR